MARTAAITNPATLEDLAACLTTEARLVDRRGRHLVLAPEVVEAFQDAIAELRSPRRSVPPRPGPLRNDRTSLHHATALDDDDIAAELNELLEG